MSETGEGGTEEQKTGRGRKEKREGEMETRAEGRRKTQKGGRKGSRREKAQPIFFQSSVCLECLHLLEGQYIADKSTYHS